MDQPSFPFFPQLPPELRREIFLMATETRIVRLQTESLVELTEQEQEDGATPFESFSNRLAPWNLTVDPKMAHFAQHWRSALELPQTPPRSSWNFCPRKPGSAIQTLLTDFGFTTTKSRRLPWTPTAECPDLPPHLLCADPLSAWHMTRPHRLFSYAPIPPLLHTCSESRGVLMRYGYQLAFGTRAAAPQTWFCFHRDLLYLPECYYHWSPAPLGDHHLWDDWDFEAGIWDLDPQDLTRVRRLALSDKGFFDEDAHPPDGYSWTSRTLRVCRNVVELFIVRRELDFNTLSGMLDACYPLDHETVNTMLELWRHRQNGPGGPVARRENRESPKIVAERDDYVTLRQQVFMKHSNRWGPCRPLDSLLVWEDQEQALDFEELREQATVVKDISYTFFGEFPIPKCGTHIFHHVRASGIFDEFADSMWDVVKLSCRIRSVLQREEQDELAKMADEGEGAGTGGEGKTWRIPIVREAIVSIRKVTDALCQTRGRFRRWQRQEGRLVPWELVPWEHRWDLLDSGTVDEGYLSCWTT